MSRVFKVIYEPHTVLPDDHLRQEGETVQERVEVVAFLSDEFGVPGVAVQIHSCYGVYVHKKSAQADYV